MRSSATSRTVERLARAKVNLFLHILGQRPDGYHRIESLAVFPELGDCLSLEHSHGLSLSLDGSFGLELSADQDNLVLRAAALLRDWAATTGAAANGLTLGAALHLQKSLPVASGIGGGSADAAAALLGLSELWDLMVPRDEMHRLATMLGADVPVCLDPSPQWMRGIGEDIAPVASLPPFALLLINPGVAVATAEVFKTLATKHNPPAEPLPDTSHDLAAFVDWLARQRNDLEPPARALRPVIEMVTGALRVLDGCQLARMSGSGATCFGMFETVEQARHGAEQVRAAQPAWWVAAAPVAGTTTEMEHSAQSAP
ncbi:MAG: 4-(cytidine 5'-diphospho)-2-C-methyl-D-erythritol kinase [Pseudomonadota bacterium]